MANIFQNIFSSISKKLRFGIEDNLFTSNRQVDLAGKDLSLNNSGNVSIGGGNLTSLSIYSNPTTGGQNGLTVNQFYAALGGSTSDSDTALVQVGKNSGANKVLIMASQVQDSSIRHIIEINSDSIRMYKNTTLSPTDINIRIDGLKDFTDDLAATSGGIGINQLYRNGSQIMIRIS